MNPRRAERGSTMAVMAGWIAILAVLCAAVLASSLSIYSASARAETRLQAQAGAEGAAVALSLAATQETGEMRIGACRVAFSPVKADAPDARGWALRVDVMRMGPDPAFSQRFALRLRRAGGERWELESLEKAG